jgi:inorganic pyrophosphatase
VSQKTYDEWNTIHEKIKNGETVSDIQKKWHDRNATFFEDYEKIKNMKTLMGKEYT